MNKSQSAFGAARRPLALVLAAVFLFVGLAGCSTTHQVSQSPNEFSGFLGDYTKLKAGKDDQANFVYINPKVDWRRYNKVYIKPVALWTAVDKDSYLGSLSKENQQFLVSYLHTSIAKKLGKDFNLVDQAGPGVIVISAAVTDARKSKPVMNVVSSIVPASMVLSASKRAITGTGSAVGSASVEVEVTDGESGLLVGAGVDKRAGTKVLRSKFDGTWGDVEKSFDYWAEQLGNRMLALKNGK